MSKAEPKEKHVVYGKEKTWQTKLVKDSHKPFDKYVDAVAYGQSKYPRGCFYIESYIGVRVMIPNQPTEQQLTEAHLALATKETATSTEKE